MVANEPTVVPNMNANVIGSCLNMYWSERFLRPLTYQEIRISLNVVLKITLNHYICNSKNFWCEKELNLIYYFLLFLNFNIKSIKSSWMWENRVHIIVVILNKVICSID